MGKNLVNARLATKILTEIAQDKMGGWLAGTIAPEEMRRLEATAKEIQRRSRYLVCIGIGGSYLGHRAVIEAVEPESPTEVLYAGNDLSARGMEKIVKKVEPEGVDFSVLVISKSGTTLEPAAAFLVFKEILVKKYGVEGAKRRIYAVTDGKAGALHDEALANGYTRFGVPENVGGRYSVFTEVGVLPMLVAGVKVEEFFRGREICRKKQVLNGEFAQSMVAQYAFFRRAQYEAGVRVEILASFRPEMRYFQEWWKQLFGESEGKRHGGMFPASVIYTSDLHSLGQYVQEGSRKIMETVVKITTTEEKSVVVPEAKGLVAVGTEKLVGRSLGELNAIAEEATIRAHKKSGIATVVIEAPWGMSERTMGFLMYFFMVACAVSAKLGKVNPFDQPGVEAYKGEMKKLL
ncbi:glucose-6-phosphate isomerase [Candidatus Saccharibacteria bacterium]|nr:glucose-6-phosphate isomerase [Candidatus Saccharibacteria bacterium]